VFVGAPVFAPLLPLIEASMLKSAPSDQRGVVLVAQSVVCGLADVLGTFAFGIAMVQVGTSMAIFAIVASLLVGAVRIGLIGRARCTRELHRAFVSASLASESPCGMSTQLAGRTNNVATSRLS
jgi:hypothetical protein